MRPAHPTAADSIPPPAAAEAPRPPSRLASRAPSPDAADAQADAVLDAVDAEAPPDDTLATERPLVLHTPVDVRSVSLAVIAVIASLVVLRWGAPMFIPLLFSLLLTYALSPLVDWLERLRVPRAAGAALLLLGLGGGLGTTGWALADDAVALIDSLPVAAAKVRTAVRDRAVGAPSPLDTVQKAAAQIEAAANEGRTAQSPRGALRVQVEKPPFNIRDYVWTGTLGIASFAGQVTIVVFLTFFALSAGDTFRRKLVKITGPSLAKKKITVQVLDEITGQIQRYLLVQLFTSVLVGLATWLVYWMLGVEYAAVWGVAAAVLNLVPYLGSIAITAASAVVAFLQFGTVEMAVTLAVASLVIHTISGNLLTPWLTSRTSRMSPVAIFVGVLVWGWLWGVWGLLLGIPIMMVIKAVCDRVDDLKPVGELLGN